MNTVTEAETATDVFIETLTRMNGEIESAIETLEIMSDPETLNNIEEGLREIRTGKGITFEIFLKKHGY